MKNGRPRRSVWTLLALALVVALALPWVAFADNVQNDVVAGGNDTITAGDSTTVNYRITANSGDGQTGCNASDGSPATVTIHTASAVTATPSTLVFSACADGREKNEQAVVFTAAAPGDYPITVSVSDDGDNGTYNTSPGEFTLHVLPPPTSSDTTPPVITPSVSGTLGNNGWYVSDVTVSWSVVDDESAISSSSGCGSTTINTDTAGTTLTCTATSAGGTSSESVTIKRDATPPTASASASPEPNANGWNNTDVTVSFSGADGLSGIDFCDAAAVLSSEGTGQSASGTCTDEAGNVSAPATASGINIDKTAPSVSLVGGPADRGSYYFGFVPAAPTCSASDALSGLDGSCSVSGYSTAVGTHIVTATATDKAGNSASASATYTVLAWTLKGFYRPVDMGDVLNTVKNGSTVPLKFEVFAGSTELTDLDAVKSLTTQQVPCDANALVDDIDIATTATGGTSLRYDATAGQYVYNWQTPKTADKCYRVTMTTQDDTSLFALIKLK